MAQKSYPYKPDKVTSPGYTLKEILETKGLTQTELAERMNRPLKTISEIINGKTQITSETALQLENVLGVPAQFWLNRESRYREYLAKVAEKDMLEQQTSILPGLPLTDLRKREIITKTRDKLSQVKQCLQFFGVNNLNQIESIYAQKYRFQLRKSKSHKADTYHLAAWIREGQLRAEEIITREYDKTKFRKALQQIKEMTREEPNDFVSKIRELCSRAGVAFVLVPQYEKSRVSGLARWLKPEKALIQLSIRYKTDDHFWFSFFHEAAHILLHSKKETFLDNYSTGGEIDEIEKEANEFSANFLIPESDYDELISIENISKEDVLQFAEAMGIAPGIVVGRLQHDGVIPYNWMNDLKRKFKWVTK